MAIRLQAGLLRVKESESLSLIGSRIIVGASRAVKVREKEVRNALLQRMNGKIHRQTGETDNWHYSAGEGWERGTQRGNANIMTAMVIVGRRT